MAWTLSDSGTVTTDGTEQTLSTRTGNASFVFEIDMNAMVNGDAIEIRFYIKTLTGGTEHLNRYLVYYHAQGEPVKQFEPKASDISFKVTIKRVAGTDRAYPWKILSI